MQALDKAVHADMKQMSEYFGELHEVGDPARVLRVIRNFMPVFAKTLDEVKVHITAALPILVVLASARACCFWWQAQMPCQAGQN